MSEENGRRSVWRRRLWIVAAAVVVLLAVVLIPPYISVSRYKGRITQLLAASVGRPVKLSSVELQLLPLPGFVLTDLSIADDPAYSVEPVLHADTVTAHIRLLSLWRGRLEIGSISVEDASLNIVRTASGRWNLDPLLRNAAAHAQSAASQPQTRAIHLPSLRATSTRINFKNGAEKLPLSLVNANISFWQGGDGEWRMQLRCQPARTDIAFDPASTGVLRAEATLHAAPELRQVPIHLDLNWREAQLGELNRLVLGSDSGWRGDLTAELSLDGTPDNARVSTRVRAIGVHRAEFAPAEPLDFDARCNLQTHFSERLVDNIACESPLGGGRFRLTGAVSTGATPPNLALELNKIPVAAALDLLRTVRSDFGQGLEASGTISGRMDYAPKPAVPEAPKPARKGKSAPVAPPSPLTGSFAVENLEVRGKGLDEPVRTAKFSIDPAPYDPAQPMAVTVSAAIPAGAPQPVAVAARLSLEGYQLSIRGPAAIAQAWQMAQAAGLTEASALESLAGDPLALDLAAHGRWMPAVPLPFGPAVASTDALTGTIGFHNANWRSDYLLNHVEIAQATLHLGAGELRFDPVNFSMGPVKGVATLTLPDCKSGALCAPRFTLQFGSLDAAVAESAFLGARAPGTLVSSLLERIHPTPAPVWPQLEGTVRAESLVLGPATLRNAEASLRTLANGADISSFDADLDGGRIHMTGSYRSGPNAADKPSWKLEGSAEKLNPAQVAPVLGLRASSGQLDVTGKLELTGFSAGDLAQSAKGAMHFEWQKSRLSGTGLPPALQRFDRWTGEAEIGAGKVLLMQSQAHRGAATAAIEGSVALELPARLVFPAPARPAGPAKPAPQKH